LAVLARALQLVNALAEQTDGIGVNQLSAKLGEPPATVHRMLTALCVEGVVRQDDHSKRYRLGPITLRWAQAFLKQDTTASAAQPFLDELRSRIAESVFLTELVSDHAVCVATAESPRPLRFFMRVGQRMPWHAAASARAILAYRSDGEARRLLKVERIRRFTVATPIRLTEVMQQIKEVRAKGVATCDEELEVGVTALAAPVRDVTGEVIASVSVVAPSQRLSGDARRTVITEVLSTARRISEVLGYRGDAIRQRRAGRT
jgi:IclR family acetate operon transcriptional repressor